MYKAKAPDHHSGAFGVNQKVVQTRPVEIMLSRYQAEVK
jgi:hypothetical protein